MVCITEGKKVIGKEYLLWKTLLKLDEFVDRRDTI